MGAPASASMRAAIAALASIQEGRSTTSTAESAGSRNRVTVRMCSVASVAEERKDATTSAMCRADSSGPGGTSLRPVPAATVQSM